MSKIEEVVRSIEDAIENNLLKPGERLSSVRMAASQFRVSKNTIVEAYARLAARQLIIAKHGSGFFVADRTRLDKDKEEAVIEAYDRMSLLKAQLNQQFNIRPGDGRPPPSWMNSALPKRINAESLFDKDSDQGGYGSPLGYSHLRKMIARRFGIQGTTVSPNQIVTTFGANHALDLIIRRFLTEGQTVLVDDPGYYPLIAKLKLAKIRVIGIPRIQNGPDLDVLRERAAKHEPAIYFTQSTAHNPTGTCYDLKTAHNALKIAAQYNFKIVDDDPFVDLHGNATLGSRLWELDGFETVIFIGSYSKILSASFRSGYIIAAQEIVDALTDLKIVTSVNSSRMSEMLIASMIRSGRFDQHLKKLSQLLDNARNECLQMFSDLEIKPYSSDPNGYYTLLELPTSVTLERMQKVARRLSVFTAPGNYFYISKENSLPVSMRVNFCRSANKRFEVFLQELCN